MQDKWYGADPVRTLAGIILVFVLLGAVVSIQENRVVTVYNCELHGKEWNYLNWNEMNNLKAGLAVSCTPQSLPQKTVWTLKNR